MSSPTDSVREFLTGSFRNEVIWEALFPEVERMIRITLRLGPRASLSPDDEDLLAETTYRALDSVCRYRRTFRGRTEREACGWLWVLCRNAAAREIRKHRTRRDRHLTCDADRLQALADGARRMDPGPPLTTLEATALLSRAVPNPRWRELWHLNNRPGAALDVGEIARLTGRTPGSVAVALSRIRAAIRRELLAATR